MALLPQHKFFVYNDKLCNTTDFTPSENEGGIYEVVRVEQGIPLFLEDHLKRFSYSAKIANKNIGFSATNIKQFLHKLIAKNNVDTGNVLISCKKNLKAFFIPHNYPAPEMYGAGVYCGVLHAERKTPNAKIFQTTVREQANKLINENNFYEVLLVDHLGRITEGSRSNVFFILNDRLVTPPGNEVLLGITRAKTIQLAKNSGILFTEEDVVYNQLEKYSGAFVTGTSPKILPIKQINAINFNVQEKIISDLVEAYNNLIQQYIAQNKH